MGLFQQISIYPFSDGNKINMDTNKILKNWLPSKAAVNVLKLNGITNEMIQKSVYYLKDKSGLKHIEDVQGYSSWNSFFIMFCVKANKNINQDD